jgi:hypothetical protein
MAAALRRLAAAHTARVWRPPHIALAAPRLLAPPPPHAALFSARRGIAFAPPPPLQPPLFRAPPASSRGLMASAGSELREHVGAIFDADVVAAEKEANAERAALRRKAEEDARSKFQLTPVDAKARDACLLRMLRGGVARSDGIVCAAMCTA